MTLITVALASAIAIPLKWTTETSRVEPVAFECFHGETISLQASFLNYGKPFDISSLTPELYWQTNGMGYVWWKTNAVIVASNSVSAVFTGKMDPGVPQVKGFLGFAGENYRAAFTLRFRPSPGAEPNTVPLPIPTLDFATVQVLNPSNAPWLMYETDPHIAAATNELYNVMDAKKIEMPASSVAPGLFLSRATNGVEWVPGGGGGGSYGHIDYITGVDNKHYRVRAMQNPIGQWVLAVEQEVTTNNERTVEQEYARAYAAEDELRVMITDEVARSTETDNDLDERIRSIGAMGRFLSSWNAVTGRPATEPKEDVLEYLAGDYYIVGACSTNSVNYIPNGTEYHKGTASTTVAPDEVSVNDVYRHTDDGGWAHVKMAGVSVTFAQIAGDPTNNLKLAYALANAGIRETAITNIAYFVTTNTVTKEFVESLGIEAGIKETTATNIAEYVVGQYDATNLVDRFAAKVDTNDFVTATNTIHVAVTNLVADIAAQIVAETNRAYTIETNLAAQIVAETNRAYTVETNLASQIVAETNRAYTVETNLAAQIVAETNRAQIVETNLAAQVVAETNRAYTIETNLAAQIVAETNRAYTVETNIAASVVAETNRAYIAETNLAAIIVAETNRATVAETNLAAQIVAETNRATVAETNLAAHIVAETNRAIQAEAAISNAVPGIVTNHVESGYLATSNALEIVSAAKAAEAYLSATNYAHVADTNLDVALRAYADQYAGQAPGYACVSNRAMIALTNHQSLAGYAKEAWVESHYVATNGMNLLSDGFCLQSADHGNLIFSRSAGTGHWMLEGHSAEATKLHLEDDVEIGPGTVGSEFYYGIRDAFHTNSVRQPIASIPDTTNAAVSVVGATVTPDNAVFSDAAIESVRRQLPVVTNAYTKAQSDGRFAPTSTAAAVTSLAALATSNAVAIAHEKIRAAAAESYLMENKRDVKNLSLVPYLDDMLFPITVIATGEVVNDHRVVKNSDDTFTLTSTNGTAIAMFDTEGKLAGDALLWKFNGKYLSQYPGQVLVHAGDRLARLTDVPAAGVTFDNATQKSNLLSQVETSRLDILAIQDKDDEQDEEISKLKRKSYWVGSKATVEDPSALDTELDTFVSNTIGRVSFEGDQVTVLDVHTVYQRAGDGHWKIFTDSGAVEAATRTQLGVVKIGDGIDVTNGVISVEKDSAITVLTEMEFQTWVDNVANVPLRSSRLVYCDSATDGGLAAAALYRIYKKDATTVAVDAYVIGSGKLYRKMKVLGTWGNFAEIGSGGGGGGSAEWGSIGGNLSDQLDLKSALADKLDKADVVQNLSDNNVKHAASIVTLAEIAKRLYIVDKEENLPELGNQATFYIARKDQKCWVWLNTDNAYHVVGGGSGRWGEIAGDIDDQTDLKAVLDAKAYKKDLPDYTQAKYHLDVSTGQSSVLWAYGTGDYTYNPTNQHYELSNHGQQYSVVEINAATAMVTTTALGYTDEIYFPTSGTWPKYLNDQGLTGYMSFVPYQPFTEDDLANVKQRIKFNMYDAGMNVKGSTNRIVVCAGDTWQHGASFELYGKGAVENTDPRPGYFYVIAHDGSLTYNMLIGKPDGSLTWGTQAKPRNVLRTSGYGSSGQLLVSSGSNLYQQWADNTVGGTAQPVYQDAGVIKACSGNVGGTAKPVYMDAGTVKACSSTVGGAAQPVYMNSGTVTACSSTVGSTTKPVYMNAGTITQGSTYAGGTAVTLNNVGKSCSTASFYAPTGAGAATQLLTSTAGAPEWRDIETDLTGEIEKSSGTQALNESYKNFKFILLVTKYSSGEWNSHPIPVSKITADKTFVLNCNSSATSRYITLKFSAEKTITFVDANNVKLRQVYGYFHK